jgi:hypothetical protein
MFLSHGGPTGDPRGQIFTVFRFRFPGLPQAYIDVLRNLPKFYGTTLSWGGWTHGCVRGPCSVRTVGVQFGDSLTCTPGDGKQMV